MAEAKPEAAQGGGKKKMIIIIVIAVLVAVGGGVGATMMLMGGKADKHSSASKKDKQDEETADAEDGGEGEDEAAAEGEEGEEGGEGKAGPVYVALEPAFVVNFQDQKKHTKFLKAEISVVAKSPKVQEAITLHMPAIRNGMVMLLSRQVYEDLLSQEGKDKLRAEALTEVKNVMAKAAGKKVGKGVEEVYFSSLVMQ